MIKTPEFTDIETRGSWNGSVKIRWLDSEAEYFAYFRLSDGQPDVTQRIVRQARPDNKHFWRHGANPAGKRWMFVLGELAKLLDELNIINAERERYEAWKQAQKLASIRDKQNMQLLLKSRDLLFALRAMNFCFGYGSSATFEQQREALSATSKVLAELSDIT